MKTTGWTWLALALALAGPGVIAMLWKKSARNRVSLGASAFWLAAFVVLLATVLAIALWREEATWAEIGFGAISWLSVPFGIMLAVFFIGVFGPFASWALARAGAGSFDSRQGSFAALPIWYLCLMILIVAAGEEWLYRGYAIERLQVLTGSAWLAGVVSLCAFGVVHLPLWGTGVALTTVVSGGIFTALYIWQRDISFLILAHVITDLFGLVVAPDLRNNASK
jgi:membrane protease YdiL (CAAX protease family)